MTRKRAIPLRHQGGEPGFCPRCAAPIPAGQVGQSHGRWVGYCTLCETYWVFSRLGARGASPIEKDLARRDLFTGRGLSEPVDST